jgi:hypothetical protein
MAEGETTTGLYHGLALDHTALSQYHILLEQYDKAAESFGEAAEFYLKRVHNVIENTSEMNRQAVRRIPTCLSAGCIRAILSGDTDRQERICRDVLAVDKQYRDRVSHPMYYHLARLDAALVVGDEKLARDELEAYLTAAADTEEEAHPELYRGLIEADGKLVKAEIEDRLT